MIRSGRDSLREKDGAPTFNEPFYDRYPKRCPQLRKWQRDGRTEISFEELENCTMEELFCVLVYTVRDAKRKYEKIERDKLFSN